jgi:hypothetical protein
MLEPPQKNDRTNPVHPADVLTRDERCRIYYSRVVDLAVASGLLTEDPGTEIGHFAFSHHYFEGKDSDLMLQRALHEFEEKFPELVVERKATKDQVFMGAVGGFLRSDSPVRFRKDLTDFMKRRIIVMLRKAGKLGHSDLFGMW